MAKIFQQKAKPKISIAHIITIRCLDKRVIELIKCETKKRKHKVLLFLKRSEKDINRVAK